MLAKTDEGQTSLVHGEFNLSDLILNTTLEFESRAFEDEKVFSYDIKKDILYIGDEKQMKQLMSIIIDNAFRYSDTSGQIRVSLRADGGHKLISVFNTGSGISDDERNKVFNVKKQISPPQKAQNKTSVSKSGHWKRHIKREMFMAKLIK